MNILVVFYSMTGNVAALAQAVVEGAKQAGADVRVRQAPELIPPAVIEKHSEIKETREKLKHIPIANNDDLRWADGVAFGSPTRYGNMCAQLKEYIDMTGELWTSGELAGKIASVFTSTSTQHGGQESTLLSMMVPLFHLGFIVQGLPYTETQQSGMKKIHGGSPYGASSVSGTNADRSPTDVDLDLARALGRRLAITAGRLAATAEQERSSPAKRSA